MDDTDLYEQWCAAKTEKDMAVLEQLMWEFGKGDSKNKIDYLRGVLRVGKHFLYHRDFILRAGDGADVLWKLIAERKITLTTASKIVAKANSIREGTIQERVLKALDAYNALPFVRVINGVPNRLKASNKPKSVWKRIRKEIEEYLDKELQGLDLTSAKKLRASMLVSIDIMLSDLQWKASKARVKAKTAIPFNKLATREREIDEACDILGLKRPKNLDAEFMKQAKTQKRRMVMVYHTDTGEESASVEKYTQVINAYNTLESMADLTTTTDGAKV